MFLFSLSLLNSKHKLTWLVVLFLYAAPTVWNTLPYEGRSSNPSSFYKSSLKTQFFSLTLWCMCPLTHPHFTSHLSKPSFSVWPYDVCVCVLCVCVHATVHMPCCSPHQQAVRQCTYGRPGVAYIDMPGDLIVGKVAETSVRWVWDLAFSELSVSALPDVGSDPGIVYFML